MGQAATLWAELQAAYDRQEPIVLVNWMPNVIEAKSEGEFVRLPEYEPACLGNPAWGINPDEPWIPPVSWTGRGVMSVSLSWVLRSKAMGDVQPRAEGRGAGLRQPSTNGKGHRLQGTNGPVRGHEPENLDVTSCSEQIRRSSGKRSPGPFAGPAHLSRGRRAPAEAAGFPGAGGPAPRARRQSGRRSRLRRRAPPA